MIDTLLIMSISDTLQDIKSFLCHAKSCKGCSSSCRQAWHRNTFFDFPMHTVEIPQALGGCSRAQFFAPNGSSHRSAILTIPTFCGNLAEEESGQVSRPIHRIGFPICLYGSHATAAFTLNICAHTTQNMRRQSADRMERFIQLVSGANQQ